VRHKVRFIILGGDDDLIKRAIDVEVEPRRRASPC
jgi:hypothetical protein